MLELVGFFTIKDFFRAGGAALSALGHDDAAAVLIGKADAMSAPVGQVGTDWWLEPVAATEANLVARLGEQKVATLAAQGAALENAEAVAYLRAQADAVLREN